ncbi:hypothetical protein NA57DRAFT_58633 [Rhizodiscina lignyota]|uniref:Uncharacterized protein n=1 Tax=Rhizodiscina lignyota TaxID=1504668 RepID=A0A9P4I827_9PEZI|nr:hypothetical protein NA57DRAFT_58633 [Rhizodiscina lignyota]
MARFSNLSLVNLSSLLWIVSHISLAVALPQSHASLASAVSSPSISSVQTHESTAPTKSTAPTNSSQPRHAHGPQITNPGILAAIIVPLLVVLIIGVSLYTFCRARGRARDYEAKEIVTPTTSTHKDRNAFYDLGRNSCGAGYDSVSPLNPVYSDLDSPRSSTFREAWRHGHNRHVSIDSDACESLNMIGALPGSPRSDGRASSWSGRYTPVPGSGRTTPIHGRPRSKTPGSVSNISLPISNTGDSSDLAPMAWSADRIVSDGSDRATPTPTTPRMIHSPTVSFHDPHSQDIASLSPYYDPDVASRRMTIPLFLATPPSPESSNFASIGEAIATDGTKRTYDLPVVEESEHDGSHQSSRPQTMMSVTTIRSSVDTIRAEWREQLQQNIRASPEPDPIPGRNEE